MFSIVSATSRPVVKECMLPVMMGATGTVMKGGGGGVHNLRRKLDCSEYDGVHVVIEYGC